MKNTQKIYNNLANKTFIRKPQTARLPQNSALFKESEIEMKTANTIKQLNIFFQKITKTNNNYIEKIEYEDWLYLKSATKNINNIITKLLTKSCAVWASDFFTLSKNEKKVVNRNCFND